MPAKADIPSIRHQIFWIPAFAGMTVYIATSPLATQLGRKLIEYFRIPPSKFRIPLPYALVLPPSPFRIPTSEFPLPPSNFPIPHSTFRIPTSTLLYAFL
jgi:hypothetical protein